MSFLINPFIYSVGCSGSIISTTNLTAYYKFDSNANDSSGSGLNGTAIGSPTYTTGKFGDAIDFNGSSQYVSVPDSTLLEGSGGSISVFCWVNMDGFGDGAPHAVAKWGTTTGWRLVPRSGDILITLAGTNIGRGTGVPTGSWVHIGFTYNNSILKVYQNGSQVGTDASVGALTLANVRDMHIGKRNNAPADYLDGRVDEVNVWQRVLSPTEISTIYNSTCPINT